MAANEIMNGGAAAAIGSGVESITMSNATPSPNPRIMAEKPGLYMAMGVTAEVVSQRYGVTREQQDEYSLLSQQRTARAQEEGFFDEEITPMTVTMLKKDKATGEES